MSARKAHGTSKKGQQRRERQVRYTQSGRQIACVIRNPDALANLALLDAKCGGVTAAVTYALRKSKC